MKDISITDDGKELTITNLRKLYKAWQDRRNSVNLRMDVFGGIDNLPISYIRLREDGTHDCGTDCCLLGLAPEVLEVDLDKHFDAFNTFSYKLFGITHFHWLHSVQGSEVLLWDYLFGDIWSNNLDEALGRMDSVIKGEVTHDNVGMFM